MKTHCDIDVFYSGVSVEIRRFKRGRSSVKSLTLSAGSGAPASVKEVQILEEQPQRIHTAASPAIVERWPV